MRRMTTTELAHSIKATLEDVSRGEYVEVTRGNEVLARLVPPEDDPRTPLERLVEASRELGEDEREDMKRAIVDTRASLTPERDRWA